jgi:Skp family chaperone for outer membrane proteins
MEAINHHIEILKEIKTNETLNQIEKEKQVLYQTFEEEKKRKQNEIDKISTELESFRAKQETINQEILRRRELEEKADFYRVCLSNETIMDIVEL